MKPRRLQSETSFSITSGFELGGMFVRRMWNRLYDRDGAIWETVESANGPTMNLDDVLLHRRAPWSVGIGPFIASPARHASNGIDSHVGVAMADDPIRLTSAAAMRSPWSRPFSMKILFAS